jgi:hypothetical protein
MLNVLFPRGCLVHSSSPRPLAPTLEQATPFPLSVKLDQSFGGELRAFLFTVGTARETDVGSSVASCTKTVCCGQFCPLCPVSSLLSALQTFRLLSQ